MKCFLWSLYKLLLTDLIHTWLLVILMTWPVLLSAQRYVMSTKWSRTSVHCHYQLIRPHISRSMGDPPLGQFPFWVKSRYFCWWLWGIYADQCGVVSTCISFPLETLNGLFCVNSYIRNSSLHKWTQVLYILSTLSVILCFQCVCVVECIFITIRMNEWANIPKTIYLF